MGKILEEGEKRVGISITLSEGILKKLDEFRKKNFKAERSAVIEESLKKFLEENGK